MLGAFAFMRQDVGYVQSMSYIAAMFLLYSCFLFCTFWMPHSSASYSDTPFDAFVCFSNVIVRPFFQNYLKRREVSGRSNTSLRHLVACSCSCFVFNRKIRSRGIMLFSEYSEVCPPLSSGSH